MGVKLFGDGFHDPCDCSVGCGTGCARAPLGTAAATTASNTSVRVTDMVGWV